MGRSKGVLRGLCPPATDAPEVVVTGHCPAQTPAGGPAAPTHPRDPPPGEELRPTEHPWGGNPMRPQPQKQQTPRAHERAHTCRSVPAPCAPLPGGCPCAGAAGSEQPPPRAVSMRWYLFNRAAIQSPDSSGPAPASSPDPAAALPPPRTPCPLHPGSPGDRGGDGGEPRGWGGGLGGGWHQVSALGLCPSVCLGTWGASPVLPLGPNCKDKLQLSRGLSKRIAFCPKCQPLVWQGRCRIRTRRMWVQCPVPPAGCPTCTHIPRGGGTGGSPSQDPTGTHGDRRVPCAAPTVTALALGTGTECPAQLPPASPRPQRAPSPPAQPPPRTCGAGRGAAPSACPRPAPPPTVPPG